MSPENFCYWLQGWLELNETINHQEGATKETIDMIKRHLSLVFENVTDNLTSNITLPELARISTRPLCGDLDPVKLGLKWEEDYFTKQKEPIRYC